MDVNELGNQRYHQDISYPNASSKEDDDQVLAYAEELLGLGLLLMEFVDSVREGDGERIFRCWRFFLPIFKVSGRTNYVVEAFNLLFQYEYAFTERMKEQLMWERFINTHGRPGKNVSMDLHMEHINRVCKEAMGTLGPNTCEQSVDCIGKSVGTTMKIVQKFDQVNGLREESGYHSKRSVALDMDKLVTKLHSSAVFEHIAGRKHIQFPKFQKNMTRRLKLDEFQEWMKKQVKKYEMFYL